MFAGCLSTYWPYVCFRLSWLFKLFVGFIGPQVVYPEMNLVEFGCLCFWIIVGGYQVVYPGLDVNLNIYASTCFINSDCIMCLIYLLLCILDCNISYI